MSYFSHLYRIVVYLGCTVVFSQLFNLALAQNKEFSPQDSTLISFIDTSQYLKIGSIRIQGNKITKSRIIQRELDFKENDSILFKNLKNSLEKTKNRIFNTQLFISVNTALIPDTANTIHLIIQVLERWYIFPAPIFELADRNFNEWWYERGRDLRRTEYGLRLDYYNFRGRNETLKFVAQFGFTQKFELGYEIPYLTRSQKIGLDIKASYATTKNLAYKTKDHKLEYIRDEDNVLRTQLEVGIGLSFRNKFYDFHFIEFQFRTYHINDTIAFLNPSYFSESKTRQHYDRIAYSYKKDIRNSVAYPLTGYYYECYIEKLGLLWTDDVNQLTIENTFSKFIPLSRRFYFATRVKLKVSLPTTQPYINFRGLGYSEDFVRGYERYTIEGQHYFLNRNTMRFKVTGGQFNFKSLIPIKQFSTIPFAIYIKAYFDWGYVQNNMIYPENTLLSNHFLRGGGAGIDIVTFYDLVFRMEYSINHLLEKGFFLSLKKDI